MRIALPALAEPDRETDQDEGCDPQHDHHSSIHENLRWRSSPRVSGSPLAVEATRCRCRRSVTTASVSSVDVHPVRTECVAVEGKRVHRTSSLFCSHSRPEQSGQRRWRTASAWRGSCTWSATDFVSRTFAPWTVPATRAHCVQIRSPRMSRRPADQRDLASSFDHSASLHVLIQLEVLLGHRLQPSTVPQVAWTRRC